MPVFCCSNIAVSFVLLYFASSSAAFRSFIFMMAKFFSNSSWVGGSFLRPRSHASHSAVISWSYASFFVGSNQRDAFRRPTEGSAGIW
uniref:Putative secreted protein n=1 Tax=Anopheles darlingi TaxID=43151 RepID=A0A2M4DFD9_ANODA